MSDHGHSPSDYDQTLRDLAEHAFEAHQLRECDLGRWLLQRREGERWQSCYWTEVVALRGGVLLAHGDIEYVLFARCSHSDPRKTLAWMGTHPLVDGYVVSKAVLGTSEELVYTDDSRVLIHQLSQELQKKDEWDPEHLEAFREAIQMARSGEGVDEVRRELLTRSDVYYESDWVFTLGRVVDPRVYYAHAAVRRLEALLAQEEVSR